MAARWPMYSAPMAAISKRNCWLKAWGIRWRSRRTWSCWLASRLLSSVRVRLAGAVATFAGAGAVADQPLGLLAGERQRSVKVRRNRGGLWIDLKGDWFCTLHPINWPASTQSNLSSLQGRKARGTWLGAGSSPGGRFESRAGALDVAFDASGDAESHFSLKIVDNFKCRLWTLQPLRARLLAQSRRVKPLTLLTGQSCRDFATRVCSAIRLSNSKKSGMPTCLI
jgi:hypothetical protein